MFLIWPLANSCKNTEACINSIISITIDSDSITTFRSVLPASVITNDEPDGTGTLLASAVDVEELLSKHEQSD